MYGSIRDKQGILISAKKSVTRKIGHKGASSVQANKVYAAVLYRNGSVRIYRSQTGVEAWKISHKEVINIDLQGAILAISLKDGREYVYDLKRRILTAKSTNNLPPKKK